MGCLWYSYSFHLSAWSGSLTAELEPVTKSVCSSSTARVYLHVCQSSRGYSIANSVSNIFIRSGEVYWNSKWFLFYITQLQDSSAMFFWFSLCYSFPRILIWYFYFFKFYAMWLARTFKNMLILQKSPVTILVGKA